MGNPIVYCYIIGKDTGFAPCYDDGEFTLACCKPRIRKSIYKRFKEHKSEKDIWVIGVKHDGQSNGQYKSFIVYIAHITKVLGFKEYFSDANENRKDCIYKDLDSHECEKNIDSKEWIAKRKKSSYRKKAPENPHFCNLDLFRKDISGLCVLYSDDFYYLGKNNKNDCAFKDVFEHCKKRRPGDFFYAKITSEELNGELKVFKERGLHNPRNIKPIDEDKCCKCNEK